MEEKSNVTLKKIQEAAMAEFLDKGFQGASLRQIVKNAGVTTGPSTATSPARRLSLPPSWSRTRPL